MEKIGTVLNPALYVAISELIGHCIRVAEQCLGCKRNGIQTTGICIFKRDQSSAFEADGQDFNRRH